jgi:hypothetical protein
MTEQASTQQNRQQQDTLDKDRFIVNNGSTPDTSKPVRLIEVPIKHDGLSWTNATDELKSGIWAVALTIALLWLGTAKLRDTLLGHLNSYVSKHLEVLETVKDKTNENNLLIKRLLHEYQKHNTNHTK